jgi:hypothetical protein
LTRYYFVCLNADNVVMLSSSNSVIRGDAMIVVGGEAFGRSGHRSRRRGHCHVGRRTVQRRQDERSLGQRCRHPRWRRRSSMNGAQPRITPALRRPLQRTPSTRAAGRCEHLARRNARHGPRTDADGSRGDREQHRYSTSTPSAQATRSAAAALHEGRRPTASTWRAERHVEP